MVLRLLLHFSFVVKCLSYGTGQIHVGRDNHNFTGKSLKRNLSLIDFQVCNYVIKYACTYVYTQNISAKTS